MKNIFGNLLVWVLILSAVYYGLDLFLLRPSVMLTTKEAEHTASSQLYTVAQENTTPQDWEAPPSTISEILPPANDVPAIPEPGENPTSLSPNTVDAAAMNPQTASSTKASDFAMNQVRTNEDQSRFRILVLLLAFLGSPLFAVLGAMSLFISKIDTMIFVDITGKLTGNNLFIPLPLFTLAGYVLSESKAPERLVRFSRSLLGWLPGGTVLIAVASCAFFTAFTGASGVTIVALGGLLYPMMRREQYSENFTLGMITSGGSLGLLFPPSLPLILYAVIAQNSMQGLQNASQFPALTVEKLFLAGIIPGTLMVLVLAMYGSISGLRHQHQIYPFSFKELGSATAKALPELLIPVLIIVVFFGGYMQLNQAAAVSALYIILIETLWYRDIKFSQLPGIFRRSMIMIGAILIILMMAMAMTSLLIMNKVPDQILELMKQHIHSSITFLIFLNLFLLIVGCLMDIFSATLVVVPLLIPIAVHFQIDPLHLGVIFLINLSIGYCTPPVGMNLFLTSLRFQRSIFKITYTCLPFLFLLLSVLAVVTYIPDISIVPANHPIWIAIFGAGLLVLLVIYSFFAKFLLKSFASKNSDDKI